MDPINQVLSLARHLELQNKKPTVALLKSKLGKMPMPILIQGLQKFNAMAQSERKDISVIPAPMVAEESDHFDDKAQLEDLQNKYAELTKAYTALEKRVLALESK